MIRLRRRRVSGGGAVPCARARFIEHCVVHSNQDRSAPPEKFTKFFFFELDLLRLSIQDNMAIDTKHKTSTANQMALDMLDERRRMVHYPPPPTCTPSAHTPSLFSGRSSTVRQSTDTPLSMYAMHRAKYKMSVLSSILSPRGVPQTVQVGYYKTTHVH